MKWIKQIRLIDDVTKQTKLVPLPGVVGGSGLEGDSLFAFELQGIHLGANTVAPANLVDLVDPAGVMRTSTPTIHPHHHLHQQP